MSASGPTRTGAARPLPPSADIGPGGQSVGQATQFCLVVEHVVGGEMQPSRAIDPEPPGIGIDAAAQRGIGPDVNDDLAGFFGTGRSARLEMKASALASTGLRTLIVTSLFMSRSSRTPRGNGGAIASGWTSIRPHSQRIASPDTTRLMERQVVIELAGGVAEAIYRGD